MKKLYIFLLTSLITVAGANANTTVPTPQQIKQARALITHVTASVKNKPGLNKTAAMRTTDAVPIVPDSAYEWARDTDDNAWADTAYLRVYYWNNAAGASTDSAIAQAYNAGTYINAYEIINTSDANGNLLTLQTLHSNGVEMVPYELETYTYDAHNNELTYLAQLWNGSSYDNSLYISDTYDTNNNDLIDSSLYWGGSAYTNGTINSMTYDSNSNRLSDTVITLTNSIYSYAYLDEFVYDTKNNNILIRYKNWNDSTFQNSGLVTNTFDMHNHEIQTLSQLWIDSVYQTYGRDTLFYDGNNNELADIYQEWNDSVFVNSQEYVYQYDANNNQISRQFIRWDGAAWVVHVETTEELYDNYNRQLMYLDESFNTAGDSIVSGDSTYNYFGNVITDVPHYAASGLQLYPNPAGNLLTLTSDETLAPSRIIVFDALGRQVFAPIYMVGETARINTSALKAGVYSLRMTGQQGVSVRQFVKE